MVQFCVPSSYSMWICKSGYCPPMVCLFARFWSGTRILIKCDNDDVVKVFNAGKAREPFWACALATYGICQLWQM